MRMSVLRRRQEMRFTHKDTTEAASDRLAVIISN
jgi:hypothetical protein